MPGDGRTAPDIVVNVEGREARPSDADVQRWRYARSRHDTVLDVIRSFAGEELTPRLAEGIARWPAKRLSELFVAAEIFRQTAEVPPPASGHLRPFLYLDFLPMDLWRPLSSETGPFDRLSWPSARVTHQFNLLRHYLLYCHSVALEDVLPQMLVGYWEHRRDPISELSDRWTRERLRNHLAFLAHLAPLVDAGVVVLVEPHPPGLARTWNRFTGWLQWDDLVDLTTQADFSEFEQYHLDEDDGSLSDFEIGGYRREAAILVQQAIGYTMDLMQRYPGAFDLFFPAQYYVDTFRFLLKRVPQRVESVALREGELRIMDRLLSLSVPGLKELSPKEIVTIRQDGEAFELWRASLREVLERVARLDRQLLDHDDQELRILQGAMLEAQHTLRDQTNRSKAVKDIRKGTRAFVIGGLVALGSVPILGAPAALAGAGAGTAKWLLDSLWSYSRSRGPDPQQALLHHYLLFREGQPAQTSSA